MPKLSTIIETIIISILFVGAIVVPFIAIIGKNMMKSSSSSSSSSLSLQQQQQQRSIEIVYFTVGVSAIAGLAFYLYNKNKQKDNDKNDKTTTIDIGRKNKSTESTSTGSTSQKIKDIWKAGNNNNNNNSQQNSNSNSNNNNNNINRTTRKDKKGFGSKYYYAHNDSNATGGYKDGLKMEDYRMNGPRLLSRNGLSVQDETATATATIDDDDDDDGDSKEKEMTYDCDNNNSNDNNAGGKENDDVQDNNNNNNAVVKNVTNITKYLWDDPGDSKGIGTIRIDVLPSSTSSSSSPSYDDVKDVKIENVNASLMEGGRGLLVNIDSTSSGGGSSCRYQLKINKLYEYASDVKVIIKPKRLLIKIYKKKTKNYNDLVAWPQPHKKI